MKTKNEGRPRIAVIDDEPDFLLLVESWLKPDYEVAGCSSSEDLVERIRAFAPHLVLLDIHMPGESGFKICRELRAVPGLEYLPVVYLTGSKSDEDFLLHLETGGSGYLTKPITRRALLDALSERLSGQRVS